jgi:DNA invertase Pin-like site-specific DNA recombinase
MKTIGYIRVSTEEQADFGVSLDAQKDRIEAFCRAKEWDLVEVISDAGFSGKNLKRPGIQRVIDLSKKRKIDVVVVVKLDRLTRQVADLGFLTRDVFEKHEVALASVVESIDATTAAGMLMLNVLGAVAQWERDIISERTKDAMTFQKKNHKLIGSVPYGYDLGEDGKTLHENDVEQLNIIKMKKMRSRGLSYHKIAVSLNEEEISSKKGGKWYPKTVRDHFTSPKQKAEPQESNR